MRLHQQFAKLRQQRLIIHDIVARQPRQRSTLTDAFALRALRVVQRHEIALAHGVNATRRSGRLFKVERARMNLVA